MTSSGLQIRPGREAASRKADCEIGANSVGGPHIRPGREAAGWKADCKIGANSAGGGQVGQRISRPHLSGLAGRSASESGADDTGLTASSSASPADKAASCATASSATGECSASPEKRGPTGGGCFPKTAAPDSDAPGAAAAAAPAVGEAALSSGAAAAAAAGSVAAPASSALSGGSALTVRTCIGSFRRLPSGDSLTSASVLVTVPGGFGGRDSDLGASPGSTELTGLGVTATVTASAVRRRDDWRSLMPLVGVRRLLLLCRRRTLSGGAMWEDPGRLPA